MKDTWANFKGEINWFLSASLPVMSNIYFFSSLVVLQFFVHLPLSLFLFLSIYIYISSLAATFILASKAIGVGSFRCTLLLIHNFIFFSSVYIFYSALFARVFRCIPGQYFNCENFPKHTKFNSNRRCGNVEYLSVLTLSLYLFSEYIDFGPHLIATLSLWALLFCNIVLFHIVRWIFLADFGHAISIHCCFGCSCVFSEWTDIDLDFATEWLKSKQFRFRTHLTECKKTKSSFVVDFECVQWATSNQRVLWATWIFLFLILILHQNRLITFHTKSH